MRNSGNHTVGGESAQATNSNDVNPPEQPQASEQQQTETQSQPQGQGQESPTQQQQQDATAGANRQFRIPQHPAAPA